MKFNLLGKQKKIKNILSFKNSFILSDLNDIVYFNNEVLCKDVDGSSIFKIKDNLSQIFDNESGCYYYDNFIVKSNFFLKKGFQNSIYLAESVSIRISRGCYKKDILKLNSDLQTSSKIILKETEYNLITYSDDILVVGNEQMFLSYNVSTSDLLWQFDILSIGNNPHNDVYNKEAEWEVKKFIGVLEDKLWIALNHHTIIALDIKTGQLVHRIDRIDGFKCEWLPSAIPLPVATVIDEKNNKLIGFMWEFYWEINPVDGTLIFIDLTEELKRFAIRNDLAEFVLTDDSIYFASHPSESKIGLLDRQSKKVTWSYEFKTEEGEREVRIMQLQGNEEKIGALSSAKTLYIFEKE